MNLLAIDTAVSVLSVALAAGEGTWHFEADAGLRHSELLMETVNLLVHRAGIGREELSGVLCMAGPGSFTGLRIGFSAAKGLALALGIPFMPIPTLDCMAWDFSSWPSLVVPAIDAKKGAYFCALYSGGKRLCPDMDRNAAGITACISETLKRETPGALALGALAPGPLALGALAPVLLTGPDSEKLCRELGSCCTAGLKLVTAKNSRRGYAPTLLEIAKERRLMETPAVDYFSGPEYIRKSDAELSALPQT